MLMVSSSHRADVTLFQNNSWYEFEIYRSTLSAAAAAAVVLCFCTPALRQEIVKGRR